MVKGSKKTFGKAEIHKNLGISQKRPSRLAKRGKPSTKGRRNHQEKKKHWGTVNDRVVVLEDFPKKNPKRREERWKRIEMVQMGKNPVTHRGNEGNKWENLYTADF